jgi:hypothetical protein
MAGGPPRGWARLHHPGCSSADRGCAGGGRRGRRCLHALAARCSRLPDGHARSAGGGGSGYGAGAAAAGQRRVSPSGGWGRVSSTSASWARLHITLSARACAVPRRGPGQALPPGANPGRMLCLCCCAGGGAACLPARLRARGAAAAEPGPAGRAGTRPAAAGCDEAGCSSRCVFETIRHLDRQSLAPADWPVPTPPA